MNKPVSEFIGELGSGTLKITKSRGVKSKASSQKVKATIDVMKHHDQTANRGGKSIFGLYLEAEAMWMAWRGAT